MAGKFYEQVAQTAAVTCKDCGAGGCAGVTGLTKYKGDPCASAELHGCSDARRASAELHGCSYARVR